MVTIRAASRKSARPTVVSVKQSIWVVLLACAGCSGRDRDPVFPVDPPAPVAPHVADIAAGRNAFLSACASCHASRDGFDLAYFGYSNADIERRASKHVSAETAQDISAYIRSLAVKAIDRNARPFQPNGVASGSDLGVWLSVMGSASIPVGLTPEKIRDLDLTNVTVPVELPLWSSEADESDWLPDRPLPDALLDAASGALRAALAGYYAQPSEPALLAVVRTFNDASVNADASVCAGVVGLMHYSDACFQARRWVSSLTAIHYLRQGTSIRDVHAEVAQLWWDTGDPAVSAFFVDHRQDPVTSSNAFRWAYLALLAQPGGTKGEGGLNEGSAYMGQFMVRHALSRVYVLTSLVRMVSNDDLHRDRPEQRFLDAEHAILRAPREIRVDVARFVLSYLVDESARLSAWPAGSVPSIARYTLDFISPDEENILQFPPSAFEEIRSLIARIRANLPADPAVSAPMNALPAKAGASMRQ